MKRDAPSTLGCQGQGRRTSGKGREGSTLPPANIPIRALSTASRRPPACIWVLSPSGVRPGSERQSPGSPSPRHPLLCLVLSKHHSLLLQSSLSLRAQLTSLATNSVYGKSCDLTEGPGPAQDPICAPDPHAHTRTHTHTCPIRHGPKSETG